MSTKIQKWGNHYRLKQGEIFVGFSTQSDNKEKSPPS